MNMGNARRTVGLAAQGGMVCQMAIDLVRAVYEARALIDISSTAKAAIRHKDAALESVAAIAHP
jgi:DNA-binding GntR family transcriptional regulator